MVMYLHDRATQIILLSYHCSITSEKAISGINDGGDMKFEKGKQAT
jgi:hypothetical protein